MLQNLDAQAIADQVLAGLDEMSMPVTQNVGAVEAVAPPFVAKLMDMELEEPSAAPKAFPAAAVAEPVAPTATASAPMNWLTDDLFA